MLKTQHHGPIYVSGFVFRRSPGKAIMLECRIEHVLAMARRFHPCVEDGLGITLSRGHVFGGWSADTRLAQSRDEAIAPTDAVADLSVTRHTPCLIKRGLLELGIGRHQRQTICLANSVENRGGIIVSGSQRHVQWHDRHRQRPTGEDQKAAPVKC